MDKVVSSLPPTAQDAGFHRRCWLPDVLHASETRPVLTVIPHAIKVSEQRLLRHTLDGRVLYHHVGHPGRQSQQSVLRGGV